jgi:hypothetical protein
MSEDTPPVFLLICSTYDRATYAAALRHGSLMEASVPAKVLGDEPQLGSIARKHGQNRDLTRTGKGLPTLCKQEVAGSIPAGST